MKIYPNTIARIGFKFRFNNGIIYTITDHSTNNIGWLLSFIMNNEKINGGYISKKDLEKALKNRNAVEEK